jgi:hypothetical protein
MNLWSAGGGRYWVSGAGLVAGSGGGRSDRGGPRCDHPLRSANRERGEVASLALMVSLATLLAGGGLGFIFGIPRAVQETSTNQVRPGYRGNTNLE